MEAAYHALVTDSAYLGTDSFQSELMRQNSVHSGKGTPRRKQKKVHKTSGTDDKKLQASLKKLNVQPIQAIEEVNMFKEDGNVIHFAAPKGTVVVPHPLRSSLHPTCPPRHAKLGPKNLRRPP